MGVEQAITPGDQADPGLLYVRSYGPLKSRSALLSDRVTAFVAMDAGAIAVVLVGWKTKVVRPIAKKAPEFTHSTLI